MNRGLSQIINISKPICINCINFIIPINNHHWDDYDDTFGKCSKFGIKSIITGKINYDYAYICREDKSKCGKEGIFFEELKNKK